MGSWCLLGSLNTPAVLGPTLTTVKVPMGIYLVVPIHLLYWDQLTTHGCLLGSLSTPIYCIGTNLHSHSAQGTEMDFDRLHWKAHNDPGCYGNKVDVQGLGDEGEGARDAKVALDDLQLVVLGDELEVARTCVHT